jgi:hypothetical protein
MKSAAARLALFALLLSLAHPALAWGQTGHRVTGEIADRHLSPRARAGIRELLGVETLAQASTWPDFMRSSAEPFWQKESGPWHYVTIPLGKRYEDVGAPPEGDAVTALKRFSATVRDPRAPLAERQKALRFIIHVVGDLSQPLHVGRAGDRGGNDVKVSWFGEPTNLHTVWDTTLVDNQKLSYTELSDWLMGDLTPGQLRDWSSPEPLQWIADSIVEREALYPADPELRYRYVFEQQERVNRQLTKGGLRLASYLNRLFEAP